VVLAVLAVHQVSARNLLRMAAQVVQVAVFTTQGLVVAIHQELQQEAVVERQPHSSGARSRNLELLAGAVPLLALLCLATQLLAQQLALRRMPACRMYLCLALVRLEAMRQTPQELVHSELRSQHLELARLVAHLTLQEAVVVVVVGLPDTGMILQLANLLSLRQPQVETAVAVAVVQVLRGAVVVRPAQELSLLATAVALRRILAAAEEAEGVWCSASLAAALWSRAKQVQAAQARRVPYTSGMWVNK
jgi:hypothetical protein